MVDKNQTEKASLKSTELLKFAPSLKSKGTIESQDSQEQVKTSVEKRIDSAIQNYQSILDLDGDAVYQFYIY